MIRDIVIHPGKTAECFRDLAEQIPTCSMDLWPFPVSGEIVRMGACIAAMIEDMVLGQAGRQEEEGKDYSLQKTADHFK